MNTMTVVKTWFHYLWDRVGAPAGVSIAADVLTVSTETDKLVGAEIAGTHSHVNNVAWQNVITLTTTTRKKVWAIWFDFNLLTQDMNMRMQYEVDGANARTFWQDTWLTTEDDGVLINAPRGVNGDLTVDLQSAVLEGAARNIPYALIYETKE